MPSNRVLEALKVTTEVCGGREFSPAAARAIASELMSYPERAVLSALERCRRELKSLTLADILSRIDDGRPGPEEAWAMLPRDEAESVVWTPEMRAAHAVCSPQIAEGDMIGARMAFREVYTRLLAEARSSRTQPEWQVSLGHDTSRREAAVKEALRKDRISLAQAREVIPMLPDPRPLKLLPAPEREPGTDERIRALIAICTKPAPTEAEAAAAQAGIEDSARRARAALERMKGDYESG